MPSFEIEDGQAEEKRDCVTYLHAQLGIDESELDNYVHRDVLFTISYHIRKLREVPNVTDERIQPHLDELKSQIERMINTEKEELAKLKKGPGAGPGPGAGTLDTNTHNTEKLKGFFLDMFFDFFVFYEKNWDSLPDDEKKKKDYFRYVREQLKTVTDLPPNFQENMEYLSNLEIDESTKKKIQDIMNNSFLDKDDNWIIPPLISETYEIESFKHFMDTVVAPARLSGGANTYIKYKLTQDSSKKTHRRLKSRTTSAARRRNNRRRRTARK